MSGTKPGPFDSTEAIELVEAMLAKGLRFHVDLPNVGTFPINGLDDSLRYLKDPDQYFADLFQVRKQTYLAWLDYQMADPVCMGTTTTGRQCQRVVSKNWSMKPAEFSKSNPDLYCSSHTEQAHTYGKGGC